MCPRSRPAEVAEVFTSYGVTTAEAGTIVAAMRQRPAQWRDFMMRFELGLEAPDPKRALQSALTIAVAYIAGGLIPLSPYLAPGLCTGRLEHLRRRHSARAHGLRLRQGSFHRRGPACAVPSRRRSSVASRRPPPSPSPAR